MSKGYRSKVVIFIFVCSLLFLCQSALAGVDVLTLAGPGTSSYQPETFFNFYDGPAYNVARGDLLNPVYFGTGGVVNAPVQMMTPVSSFNAANLTGADVVVLTPWMVLTAADKVALSNFVWNGGGLLAFGNESELALGAAFGATVNNSVWDTSGGAHIKGTSPIAAGPFGVIADTDPIGLGACTLFENTLGAYGDDFLTSYAGQIIGVSFTYGSGRAVVFTDEEIFMNTVPASWTGAAPASYSGQIEYQTLSNERLFLNSFAYVIPSAVPEPTTIFLVLLGLAGVARMRERSKQ